MLIGVDTIRFIRKPTTDDVRAGMKNRLANKNNHIDVSLDDLKKIVEEGKSWTPGVLNGRDAKSWINQQCIAIDIDNGRKVKGKKVMIKNPLYPDEARKLSEDYGLNPALMYYSFNNSDEWPRYRMVFALDTVITDNNSMKEYNTLIKDVFDIYRPGCIDTGCADLDRLFFGSKPGSVFYENDVSNSIDVLEGIHKKLAEMGYNRDSGLKGNRLPSNSTTVKNDPSRSLGRKIDLRECLPYIDPSDYDKTWIKVGMALHHEGYDISVWDEWSKRDPDGYKELRPGELQYKWDSFKRNSGNIATGDTIIHLAEQGGWMPPNNILEPSDYSDVGEACVFVENYGGLCRYSKGTGWIVYEGQKWTENDLKAQKFAQSLTDRQLNESKNQIKTARENSDNAIESGDEVGQSEAKIELDKAEGYRKFVLGRRSSNKIAATLTESRPMLEVDVKDLDSNPFLLNTPGGTVDLIQCTMRPHDPADLCTKITAVAPSKDGMDEWKSFLDRITCGDKELKDYLQLISGMVLVGKVFCENLIIAYGNGGNGKSTFFNAIYKVMGDYAGTISAEILTANCRKNKSPELAEVRAKRLILAPELEEGTRLDTAMTKKMCSTDPVKAEKKFKDPFEFIPSHTTIVYTNHLPAVGTIDKGTWDRLIVVPFLANLRGSDGEIKNYADYLFEHCGGSILGWMIVGAKKFIDANYIIDLPSVVKDAIESYRQENDWLKNFLMDCCEIHPSYKVPAGSLYGMYKTYCRSKREYLRHASDFRSALMGAGYEWHKDKNGAFYYGLQIDENALFTRMVTDDDT